MAASFARFVRVYLVPGAILQSVMIGGGYGTGREVVEYFTRHGVTGGALGIATAAVCIAVIFALTLEVSRRFGAYDYRNFFKVLLGRGWFLYEILGVMLFMLVIAVIGSAAGQILQQEFGIDPVVGVAIMLVSVVVLVFYGRDLVTRVLGYWSLFLYAVFISYLIACFLRYGDAIRSAFAGSSVEPGWFVPGLQYTFYNVTAIPIILYSARAIRTRSEALTAGVVGALIAVIPALMLHVSFATQYPQITHSALPVYEVFQQLDMSVLKVCYLIVLFGTFIETGAGNLQGFIERLDNWWRESHPAGLRRRTHALIAAGAVLLSGSLAYVGIVALIADGYGTLAWGFLLLYVLPLLTVGLYKVSRPAG